MAYEDEVLMKSASAQGFLARSTRVAVCGAQASFELGAKRRDEVAFEFVQILSDPGRELFNRRLGERIQRIFRMELTR